jgi:hypothetical protein
MEIKVSLVPSFEVVNVWDKVSRMLKLATDQSQGRYGLNDLKAKLVSGEFQLWLVFDEQFKILAAVTSTFTVYPQGKFLAGQFLGGENLDLWKDEFCRVFHNWGRDNKCVSAEFTGRAGWARALAGNGYKEVFRIYQVDL